MIASNCKKYKQKVIKTIKKCNARLQHFVNNSLDYMVCLE